MKKKKDLSLGRYQHSEKRVNNPQVGLVSEGLDSKPKKKKWNHDPHIDPSLSWTGKKEGSSFEVDTVSLHIHERIDPARIVKHFLEEDDGPKQETLFDLPDDSLALDKEFDFYGHDKNWSNRLIAGDSLLVMNSLLEKEAMMNKVQMVYIDPPYGITYNSNFQPYLNQTQVKNRDEDISAEPEMVKAFRDTWDLGIHSYLTYLRDRLLLARDLLHESGSIFVQISDANLHYVTQIMSEIFGPENYVKTITYITKRMPLGEKYLEGICDYIVWFARDKKNLKYNKLFIDKKKDGYGYAELPNGENITLTGRKVSELPKGSKLFSSLSLLSSGRTESCIYEYEYNGRKFFPNKGRSWKTNKAGMDILAKKNRLFVSGNTLRYKLFYDDYPVAEVTNVWSDTQGESNKIYAVQTNTKVIERCLLMSTQPGDIVFDPTCGSGTTAFNAEKWGRRWITCDTSRISIQLAKQRLMTSSFDYYKLARPEEGVSSGFDYTKAPHITIGSITNSSQPKEEIIYDKPIKDSKRIRVTGPFSVEAVPGIRTKPLDGNLPDISNKANPTNLASERLADYLDSIRVSGIRSYKNESVEFASVEIAEGYKEVHAFGITINKNGQQRIALVFGPDYAPMEQTQIERAVNEVREMKEKPSELIFCAYAFDPEASKDIDNIKLSDIQILKAQMNTDLLTKDLKKKAQTDRPFWLIGEPDINIEILDDGNYQVEVLGFDYYDPRSQELMSGGTEKISMWMLDTNYDNRSLFPSQVFFPMKDSKKDWTRLARSLNGLVDKDLLIQYSNVKSLPFKLGKNKTIALKIIDDRGVEMLIVKKVN